MSLVKTLKREKSLSSFPKQALMKAKLIAEAL
jgi:hypothetical protein